ncbi:MAG: histone deacetylase family protein [Acidimicrobiales bacterium]
MTLLFETHPAFVDHQAGRFHPERPERLDAVVAGIERADIVDAVVAVSPRQATRAELERVHRAEHLDRLESLCASGGGRIDADTGAIPASWLAAVTAAGAGLDAVERMQREEADAAFCAVRPPGHHATAAQAMGFCLMNNVAVCAAALAAQGERPVIIDWDAHHGNGTEAIFYADPSVLYVSLHEFGVGVYPGTGQAGDTGTGAGTGTTLHVPLPSGAAIDGYLAAFDQVVDQVVERFGPTWVLLSAGFDAHRADPLTDMGLTAADFARLTARSIAYAPAGRRVAFLEGGYDLDALTESSAACMATLVGSTYAGERPSRSAGIGMEAVTAARRAHLGVT